MAADVKNFTSTVARAGWMSPEDIPRGAIHAGLHAFHAADPSFRRSRVERAGPFWNSSPIDSAQLSSKR
jgi:hypothetical protein